MHSVVFYIHNIVGLACTLQCLEVTFSLRHSNVDMGDTEASEEIQLCIFYVTLSCLRSQYWSSAAIGLGIGKTMALTPVVAYVECIKRSVEL